MGIEDLAKQSSNVSSETGEKKKGYDNVILSDIDDDEPPTKEGGKKDGSRKSKIMNVKKSKNKAGSRKQRSIKMDGKQQKSKSDPTGRKEMEPSNSEEPGSKERIKTKDSSKIEPEGVSAKDSKIGKSKSIPKSEKDKNEAAKEKSDEGVVSASTPNRKMSTSTDEPKKKNSPPPMTSPGFVKGKRTPPKKNKYKGCCVIL